MIKFTEAAPTKSKQAAPRPAGKEAAKAAKAALKSPRPPEAMAKTTKAKKGAPA